jgi:hypothetical protein
VDETHDFVLGERAAEADLTQFNDVEVLRNFRRDVRVLLDEEAAHVILMQLGN